MGVTNFWNTGDEGVRVTVVRASDHAIVTTPIDLANKNKDNIQAHFEKISKVSYTNGTSLAPSAQKYTYVNPSKALPKIISTSSGNGNIKAIKSYFTDEMEYDILINGEYKLLLEPLAHMTFNGVKIAVTATEAAFYDERLGGGLRSKMVSLSHKNLPLAMFLEVSDLGYPAWSGSKSYKIKDGKTKTRLFYNEGYARKPMLKNGSVDVVPKTVMYSSKTSLMARLSARQKRIVIFKSITFVSSKT